jgi:hypothetical protein
MKSLLMIPMIVALALGAVAGALSIADIHFALHDPLTAAAITAAAGMAGLIPILRTHRKDAVAKFQMAMAGTVLHMAISIGLTVAVVASGTINGRGAFGYWLLGGYWVSLLTLIWQLRRLIVSAAKAQG